MLNIFNPSTLWAILNAVIDICCTWAIFYYVLKIVRNNSRTVQIFKGVVLIIIVQFIANLFDLKTMGLLGIKIGLQLYLNILKILIGMLLHTEKVFFLKFGMKLH